MIHYVKILFLFILLLTITSCDNKVKPKTINTTSSVKAEILKLEKKNIPIWQIYTGYTESKNISKLYSKVSGYVNNVFVSEGQFIHKNQKLLTIDSENIQLKVKSLEADKQALINQKKALESEFKYIESLHEKYKVLLKNNAITENEYENIKSKYLNLKENLNSLENKIDSLQNTIKETLDVIKYYDVVSPVEGVITKKFVDKGTITQVGMLLFEIKSTNLGFWFEANIEEKYLHKINTIHNLVVEIPSINYIDTLPISAIIPDVDPKTRTFKVKIDLPLENLTSGLFGRVYLQDGKKDIILIPKKAIISRGGILGVYTVGKDKIIKWRIIKTGEIYRMIDNNIKYMPLHKDLSDIKESNNVYVEVVSGLEENEIIIISNLEAIREGFRLD